MDMTFFKKRNYRQIVKGNLHLQQELLNIVRWADDYEEAALKMI